MRVYRDEQEAEVARKEKLLSDNAKLLAGNFQKQIDKLTEKMGAFEQQVAVVINKNTPDKTVKQQPQSDDEAKARKEKRQEGRKTAGGDGNQ